MHKNVTFLMKSILYPVTGIIPSKTFDYSDDTNSLSVSKVMSSAEIFKKFGIQV